MTFYPTLALLVVLLVACFTDLRAHRIPNKLILAGLVLGFAQQLYANGLGGLWQALLGLLLGFALFIPFYAAKAMAAGDVKLMGMIGAFVGWQGSLLTLFLGCVFGAVVGSVLTLRSGPGVRIPFGPYLAMGALVTLFGRETILTWLFVDWPEWQRDNPSSVMVVLGIGMAALIGLLWIIRRGRR